MKLKCLLSVGLLAVAVQVNAAAAGPDIVELDHIVAVVNSDVITALELEQRVKRVKQQLARRNTNLPPEDVLRKQILDRMIQEELEVQLAKRKGIRVDDETVNNVIQNIAQENNLSLDQFRQVLQNEGYHFANFRENIRKEIMTSRLKKSEVQDRVRVSEQEIQEQLAKLEQQKGKDEEYHLAHILIALPEGATPDQVSAAQTKARQTANRLRLGADFAQTAIAVSDGQHALQGGDMGWVKLGQLPSIFSDVVPQMKPGDVTDPVRSSSGFHIVKMLDKRSDEHKHVVEQVLARHILIKTDELTSDQQARSRLLRLRERILSGADFGKLAEANSDDSGSASQGGSLGWSNPSTFVPQFADQLKKLKPGEISMPFKSRYGWHIVQVMARRDKDDTQSFLRNQARQQIQKRKTNEELESWVRRLREEAYVDYRLNE
jgi:peptidyl-prolyl cis-trans isomerase SurA